jgi:hypothetical protein
MSRLLRLLIILLIITPLGGMTTHASDTRAAADPRPKQCFAQTGPCIEGRFLAYWQAHGGLAINGYPLSDEGLESLEDGRAYTVQYFERARLEYHPENQPPDDVLLGQLGRAVHPADPPAQPLEDGFSSYFSETGHNVSKRFLGYWERNGGRAQFGYPLGEEEQEKLANGQTYLVQYFERARFEYHPGALPPDDVELGQLGRRIFSTSFLAPPDGLPSCHAAELDLRVSGGRTGIASGGVLIGDAFLTNQGGEACALQTGYAEIAPLDGTGQPLPVEQQHFGGPDLVGPRPPEWAVVLKPGQAAYIRFNWRNWCPSQPPTQAASIRVTLPGSGEVLNATILTDEAPTASYPQCNDAGMPSSLSVDPLILLLPGYGDSTLGDYFAAINRRDYRAAYDLLGPDLQAQQSFDAFAAGFADTVHDTFAVVASDSPGADFQAIPDRLTLSVRLAAQQADGAIRRYHGTYELARVKMPDPTQRSPYLIRIQIVGANIVPDETLPSP